MWPIFARFGNFELGSYGVLLVVAVLAAVYVAAALGKRDGLDPGRMVDVGVGTTFSGIAGSKLLGVVVALLAGVAVGWDELRNAGAVHGGLMGGLLGAWLLCRHFKLPFGLALDAYVPACALGQAIGRLACFSAGCCFGSASHVPWAVTYHDPMAVTLGGVPLGVSVHPVQLYDALAHVAFFALLWLAHRRAWMRGALFVPWVIGEGLLRFALETFRGDLGRGVWFGLSWLSTGRATSMAFVLAGAALAVLYARGAGPFSSRLVAQGRGAPSQSSTDSSLDAG
ncbi:MAG TPA: prolipoprotein diacylglyceryl transferase family protein [Polyangiaceae bacterium]|nr:prolipoprotein diacylglyceryl transferase family protein [Polyangiaceae bacterium]